MPRYSKDRASRSLSIGPKLPLTSPKENAGVPCSNDGSATGGSGGDGTGAGDEFLYIPGVGQAFQMPPNMSWDVVITGGTMTALTVLLEGSDDGANWTTIDTNTVVTGGTRVVANPGYQIYRARITVWTKNASAPVVSVGITI